MTMSGLDAPPRRGVEGGDEPLLAVSPDAFDHEADARLLRLRLGAAPLAGGAAVLGSPILGLWHRSTLHEPQQFIIQSRRFSTSLDTSRA